MPREQVPPKGNPTRDRLIEAGLVLFGLHGLEATSTRALAQAAGVNLAAIPYHFGGKEGLYLAVVDHIVGLKLAEIAPCLTRVRTACDDAATGRDTLREILAELTGSLIFAMLGNPQSRACSQIMLQEQIAPTAGFAVLHEKLLLRIHDALSALIGRLTGLPRGSLELHLRTTAVMGQLFIFRIGLPSLLNLLGDDRLSPAHLEAIAGVCRQQVMALLEGFAPVCPGVAS